MFGFKNWIEANTALYIFLVFEFRTQINPITVFNPVQFTEQLGT